MSARPAADVVVPVATDAAGLSAVLERLRGLALGAGDTLTVVDNRGVGVVDSQVLIATGIRSSYHARNRGAERGAAPWIVFLDADVEPPPDLLDRLLDPTPGEGVGVLAGGVVDGPPAADGGPAAVRYAALRASMAQETVLAHGEWAFAQTAHAAFRRSAFDAAGGFHEHVRSGGDADLCWRLLRAGWRLESRPAATVVHRNRATVGGLLRQRARHGSGAAWLGRRWPGALPPRRLPGLAAWGARRAIAGVGAAVRGDRDAALLGLLDGPATLAFELGRRLPNRVR